MAAELLRRRSHAADSPRLLTVISHSVSRAQRLVADLLDFSFRNRTPAHAETCSLAQ
ncbi:hypothetical protein [Pseudomonas putida]|uniref:hypothetical protein n=1 Tax=Pseudomonas putida TaxID=303 RepID=UPI002769E4D7|nr:hypothetical protein [Pseudomonas putida]MDP9520576.1 hypothetical protein [Pseudomonas putida]